MNGQCDVVVARLEQVHPHVLARQVVAVGHARLVQHERAVGLGQDRAVVLDARRASSLRRVVDAVRGGQAHAHAEVARRLPDVRPRPLRPMCCAMNASMPHRAGQPLVMRRLADAAPPTSDRAAAAPQPRAARRAAPARRASRAAPRACATAILRLAA